MLLLILRRKIIPRSLKEQNFTNRSYKQIDPPTFSTFILQLSAYFYNYTFRIELNQWYYYWKHKEPRPNNFTDLFAIFDKQAQVFYKDMFALTCIMLTIPASTSSVERTFSSMKRILTDHRSSTGHKRLSDLAIISTYKQDAMKLVLDDAQLERLVIKFANISDRRLVLK